MYNCETTTKVSHTFGPRTVFLLNYNDRAVKKHILFMLEFIPGWFFFCYKSTRLIKVMLNWRLSFYTYFHHDIKYKINKNKRMIYDCKLLSMLLYFPIQLRDERSIEKCN